MFPNQFNVYLHDTPARAPFDAVVVEHCYAMSALPPLRRAVVVLDEHNIQSDYYRRAARRAPRPLLAARGHDQIFGTWVRSCRIPR